MLHFPISGVETYWWLPVAVAFSIACFSSMGGVSGAVLLLPFQVSVLGFGGPAASATNLLYNVIAIPSGVYRFYREKRMLWPLAGTIILATLPGMFLGAVVRIRYLPGGSSFKLFAGLVLLYIASRLGVNLLRQIGKKEVTRNTGAFNVVTRAFNLRCIEYEFNGVSYLITTWKMFTVLFFLGIVAGAYGIGGGAITAPLLVAVFRLPVHSIAGATLLATFVSSLGGVISYTALSPFFESTGAPIAPDWFLGLLFGLGGAAGIHVGARLQRYVSARLIESLLMAMTLFIAAKYLVEVFS